MNEILMRLDMRIDFVLAKEIDAMRISKLRQKVWASTYRGIYPDDMIDSFDYDWHAEKDLERIINPKYSVYRITSEKQDIGYIIIRQSSPLCLVSLYIVKEFQRQGIGKLAFEFVQEYCAERGAEMFVCQCQPDNKNAMSFYRRMGGVIIDRDADNEESWQNSVTFRFMRAQGQR